MRLREFAPTGRQGGGGEEEEEEVVVVVVVEEEFFNHYKNDLKGAGMPLSTTQGYPLHGIHVLDSHTRV